MTVATVRRVCAIAMWCRIAGTWMEGITRLLGGDTFLHFQSRYKIVIYTREDIQVEKIAVCNDPET